MMPDQDEWTMLARIWRGEIPRAEALPPLAKMLHHADYLTRSRAYALLEKMYGEYLLPSLLAVVHGEEQREWQLRALAVLAARGDSRRLPELQPLLYQRDKPLLLRAILRVLVLWGDAASLAAAVDFIDSPYAGFLKTSFLEDSLRQLVLRDLDMQKNWQRLCATRPALCQWDAALKATRDLNPLISVYPHPDYLVHMARKQGINAKTLKRALYFPQREQGKQSMS